MNFFHRNRHKADQPWVKCTQEEAARDPKQSLAQMTYEEYRNLEVSQKQALEEVSDQLALKEQEIYRLKKRISALEEAVCRWKKKVKQPADRETEAKIIQAERVLRYRTIQPGFGKREQEAYWEYKEHRQIPVLKEPELAREAWEWLEGQGKTEGVERLYYHGNHGWIAVFRVEW